MTSVPMPVVVFDRVSLAFDDHDVLRDLAHVTSILVTHQLDDAFYVAGQEAIQANGHLSIVACDRRKEQETRFLMLKDGRLYFEGNADQLRASRDPYLKRFLS